VNVCLIGIEGHILHSNSFIMAESEFGLSLGAGLGFCFGFCAAICTESRTAWSLNILSTAAIGDLW
jgi:hypothetical protein